MTTYEEAVKIIGELRERFDAPYNSADKNTIEELYYDVLGRTFHKTSCQQCYHDGVIEIYLYLKKNNKMAEKCNYRLRAGFIINCPDFRNGKIYTNDNLTDEVAAEYLSAYPANVDMFQQLPSKEDTKKAEKKATTSKKSKK